MLPCPRRATAASSWPTSNRLVAACIVSFALVSSCSLCVAQEFIDIAFDDVPRYYPGVYTEATYHGSRYVFRSREERVTFLLRSDPESELEVKVYTLNSDNKLVMINGWTDCGLRFECKDFGKMRTWTVYEKVGSEPFHQLTQTDVRMLLYTYVTKWGNGTKLQWIETNSQPAAPPVSVKDCVLESKSLGGRRIYNLSFTSPPRHEGFSVYWNTKNTVFVRLEGPTTTSEPTTSPEEPTTTPEAAKINAPTSSSPKTTTTGTTTTTKLTSEPAENPQGPPSHANDTPASEPSAAGGLRLGHLVAAVVVMQLFVGVSLST